MKLMTKAIEKKMPPIRSTEGTSIQNKEIICKFFTPWSNWTWLVLEGDKEENGDWLFFGVVFGFEIEFGYFRLSELESIRGPAGLKIERDRHLSDRHLINYMKAEDIKRNT